MYDVCMCETLLLTMTVQVTVTDVGVGKPAVEVNNILVPPQLPYLFNTKVELYKLMRSWIHLYISWYSHYDFVRFVEQP